MTEQDNLSLNILSDIVTHMKYAKYLPELERREIFSEICDRNKNMHIKKYPQLKDEIEEVYEKFVKTKKVLPSMRSMQFAGAPIEKSPNRIFNCAYLPIDHVFAFSETMFALLSGTGIGYSTQAHHIEKLPEIRKPNTNKTKRFLIGDSIEGWADSIKVLMKSYFNGGASIRFDYSDIRPKGSRLITAGGKAPGPDPLIICHEKIRSILNTKEDGSQLTSIEVHDILCHIADSVLAGGIRRAAMISLFDADDMDMISCKTGNWWELDPQRGRANNSAVLLRSRLTETFFKDLWKRIELSKSGEPGLILTNDKDILTNPCAEISLKPFQMCNLCEVNISDITSQEDLNDRIKAATFIGTLQAGYTDFHYLRPIWKKTTEKEALLGIGLTGIGSGAYKDYDFKIAAEIAKQENIRVADTIGINHAARISTIKPSGCMDPSTEIITNKGVLSLEQIFELNGYDLNELDDKSNLWLELNEEILVKDENDDWQLITKLYVNGISETYDVETEDGEIVSVTPNHKFLTSNRGWVEAEYLTPDDDIVSY